MIIPLPQRQDLLSAASNSTFMRRWLRLLAVALLTAGAAMLVLPGGTASAAASKAGVLQQAWFWQTAYEQANLPVAQQPPATEPSGVPDGDLAVAYSGSSDKSASKMTALSFDVSSLTAGSSVSDFTFALTLDSAPAATSFGTVNAPVVACQPTRAWSAVMHGDYTDEPTFDCANKVAPTVSNNTYTFKIPAIAQSWVDDQNLGVVIVPDPETVAAPFQLVFSGAKDLKADMSYTSGTTSASSSGSAAGSGSVLVPASSGSGDTMAPAPLPPPTTTTSAQPGSAPVVAASPAAAPVTRPVAAAKTAPAVPTKAFWAAALVLGAFLLIASLVLGDPTTVAATAKRSRLDQVLRGQMTGGRTSSIAARSL